MRTLVNTLRQRRWTHVFAANLRILLGFAFLPAGLKKILGGPFTDPSNTGPFHEFLHAFHATGFFYTFVGAVQVVVAVLLMTQRFASLGAALALPVFTAILVFCFSTQVYFTAVMVSLMWLGTVGLLVWDWERWRRIFAGPQSDLGPLPDSSPHIDETLWGRCGAAILLIYVAIVALSGGVYRPKGMEWGNPAFWTLPTITLFPIATYIIERARRRRATT